ncbi:hypothetical protein L484_001459 [Morus notabilis]|uniref:Uncharacterized protein n=1 Tax=Morus notabilis TaxID=981085 RepID=W9SDQ9_9ROSA|nr:hypothetical protein L484_001459 [Morus notabilis]
MNKISIVLERAVETGIDLSRREERIEASLAWREKITSSAQRFAAFLDRLDGSAAIFSATAAVISTKIAATILLIISIQWSKQL